MLKIHLSKILGEKRIKITDVSKDTGINRGTITRLYHETAERVDIKVLDQLCEYLTCSIEDLSEYVPGQED